jgi:hypothetical protein
LGNHFPKDFAGLQKHHSPRPCLKQGIGSAPLLDFSFLKKWQRIKTLEH